MVWIVGTSQINFNNKHKWILQFIQFKESGSWSDVNPKFITWLHLTYDLHCKLMKKQYTGNQFVW